MRQIPLFLSIALLSACAAAPAPQPVNQPGQRPSNPSPAEPSSAPARPPAGTAGASASAPTQPIDEKVAEAKVAYEKNPGDAAAKKAYAETSFQNAQFYMYNSPLPPNQKYPKALALYRQVLVLEPDNAAAADAVKMIEDIYTSLGKPVPQV